MSISLAEVVGDTASVGSWTRFLARIKEAVNDRLWDPTQSLYFDNDHNQSSNAVHPQDGNAWAIISGIANSGRASVISTSLMNRWVRPYGAPAEAGATR